MTTAWYLPQHSGVNLGGVAPQALTALEQAARLYGQPLPIMSGFRDPEHQARLYAQDVAEHGGQPSGLVARNSRHTEGDALDISTAGMGEEEKAQLVRSLLDAGFTGIGEYGNHIHADLRPEMGNPWTDFSPGVQAVLSERGWGPGYAAATPASSSGVSLASNEGYFQPIAMSTSAGGGNEMAQSVWPSWFNLPGAGEMALDIVGAPIDAASWVLRQAGVEPGPAPVGSSDWFNYLLGHPEWAQQNPETVAAIEGRTGAAAAPPGADPSDAIQAYYANLLGGAPGGTAGSYSFGGGGGQLLPPPEAQIPGAPDYSPVRDLISQAAPTSREEPGPSDELLYWLAGLSGGLGFDETGEILLGSGSGGLSSLLGRRQQQSEEDLADEERMRDYLLGVASAETGLIGAESQAEQNAASVEHQNKLQAWQFANQQALAQRATVDATDEHIIVQSTAPDGEITVDYIPIGSGSFNMDNASDPVEFAVQELGFDIVRQPLQAASAAAAFQATKSGIGYQLIEQLGLTEAYQEDAGARQAVMGSDFDEQEFQTQFLLQLFLAEPTMIAAVYEALGGGG